ncbi:WXG100 family type VII secretion target [Microbacterium gorillae]|uniref:WXG100 family type VII secretion target n=1 Tax=Microbacterium gorillae TaxID=1231063 RepID=UPI003D9611A3
MAEKISAEAGALLAGASAVNDTNAAIAANVRAVDGAAGATRPLWTGPAANQYFSLVERWEAEARKINQVLVTLEGALRGTASDQVATDESNQQIIGGLGATLA